MNIFKIRTKNKSEQISKTAKPAKSKRKKPEPKKTRESQKKTGNRTG
jgi:hypothetical protein